MSSAPPGIAGTTASSVYTLALEGGRSLRRRRAVEGSLSFSATGAVLDCDAVLRQPLRLPLSQLGLGAVDPGPARPSGAAGRFPVLRRLGPNAVVPRQEGIEGWLWTTLGGSVLTSLGDAEDAPNAALLFTKPLGEPVAAAAFRPEVLEAVAEASPLGAPTVLGLLLRVAETMKAESAFRRFGLLRPITDREVPPTMRRSLPSDRPADAPLTGGEQARAATSVAPPGSP